MDQKLREILEKTNKIIIDFKKSEKESLYLDAHKKVLLAELTIKAIGKSHAEREIKAQADPSYEDFIKGLSISQSETNSLKRRLDLLNNAFIAEYLEAKLEVDSIKREV